MPKEVKGKTAKQVLATMAIVLASSGMGYVIKGNNVQIVEKIKEMPIEKVKIVKEIPKEEMDLLSKMLTDKYKNKEQMTIEEFQVFAKIMDAQIRNKGGVNIKSNKPLTREGLFNEVLDEVQK